MHTQLAHDITASPINTVNAEINQIVIPEQYLRFRRLTELLLVIVFSPLMISIGLLVALIIALESKGNVLYIQYRPGKNARLFKIHKFRTMYCNASADRLTQENDDRITGVGKWLRKYRIDEIPQLWNVLKGDMSIIGPRPIPHNFHKLYIDQVPGYALRLLIRPGITGLAQVLQGYTRTVDEERVKLTYDLHYINNISAKLDLYIIWRTLTNVIRGRQ